MKRFLLILGLILCLNSAWAAEVVELEIDEQYLIISDRIIKTIEVSDRSVAEIKPFFTIFNEKNLMLLAPKKVGKTFFTLSSANEKFVFEMVIKANKNKFKDFEFTSKSGFGFLLLDKPPEPLELDKPPAGG